MNIQQEQKRTGYLKTWHAARGYGFIVIDGNQNGTGRPEKFFLHAPKIIKSGRPDVGVTVRFAVDPVKTGELPAAMDAEIVEAVQS